MARPLSTLAVAGLVLVLVAAALGSHLPSNFKRCERHGRDVDSCLQDAIQKVIKVIRNGVPTLGIPKLDPLEIKELAISSNPSGSKGPVALELTLKNIKVTNIFEDTTLVRKPKFHIDDYNGQATVTVKNVKIDAEYEAKGRVLVLPLSGHGPFNMTMKDAEITFVIALDPVTKKDGKKYAKVKDFKIDLNAKEKSVKLANLISSTDKNLSDNLNVFLNQNLDVVYSELKPAIDQAIAAAFSVYTDKIFNKVPFDEIFPEKL